jgi:predicted ATP-grasp superfamily ATP-dependent carboligase
VNNFAQPILIVGASARAAAWSAVRAGYAPLAIDRFADVDLVRCCPVQQTDGSRAQITAAADSLPAGPWMYTGGLENDPQLVGELSAKRELHGNPPETLRKVRDPATLASAVRAGGFHYPRILPATACPERGAWLVKSKRSSGGLRIRQWTGAARRGSPPGSPAAADPDSYLQQWVDGRPVGAVYVANGHGCQLLGVTEQVVGAAWTGGGRFRYAGSIGPLPGAEFPLDAVQELGLLLTDRFALRGLFGVDLILQSRRLWVIEVNPRYTASVEILERSLEVPLLAWHVAGCTGREAEPLRHGPDAACHGKAIVYARRDTLVGDGFAHLADCWNEGARWPRIADLPPVGSALRAGAPVTTVFAAASQPPEVARQLGALVEQVRAVLGC